jgi:hypothetical protein
MRLINRRPVSAVMIVLLTCCLAGCYTLLKHPTTVELTDDMDFASCTDCHDSYPYPGPYDEVAPWSPPPWWYPPVVIVNEGGKQRTIVDRAKVERTDEDSLIGRRKITPPPGVTPGLGVSTPAAGGTAQPGATPATEGQPTIIKREAPANESGTRTIENKKVEKAGGQDTKRSNETKEKK